MNRQSEIETTKRLESKKRPAIYKFAAKVNWLIQACIWVSVSVLFIWGSIALSCIDFLPWIVRTVASTIFFVGTIALLIRFQQRNRIMAVAIGIVLIVFIMWQFVRPQQNRNWEKEQILLPIATVEDDFVLLQNIRDSEYRTETDFDVRHFDTAFRIDEIQSVWFIVQNFVSYKGLAHTFISFEIKPEDGPRQYIALSVEIRREVGESFSPLWGLFKRYEIMYVVGRERDLLGVRTVMRPDDRVFLYRANASPKRAQKLFLACCKSIRELNERPQFYDTLFNNCTNNIVYQTNRISPKQTQIDARNLNIVLPGYSDKFAFDVGLIGDGKTSFEELKESSRIDQFAKDLPLDLKFSSELRRLAGMD